MGHSSLKIKPGVDINRTPVLNEAGVSETQLIRWMPDREGLGLPQKLGGWTQFISNWNSATPIRAIWAWEDTDAVNQLALGAEDALWSSSGTPPETPDDISPREYVANIPLGFSTTAGSSLVVISDIGSNVTSLDSIYIETPVAVGGLVLYGCYEAIFVSADAYEIRAVDLFGDPELATSTVTGGAVPVFSTTSGSPVVTVVLANHGYAVGDSFPVMFASTIGTSGITLTGNCIVDTVVDDNTFTTRGPVQAATTQTGIPMNDGLARILYFIGVGALPIETGYGEGTYGGGGYGTGVAVTTGREFSVISGSGTGSVATLLYNGNVAITAGSLIIVDGTPDYDGTWPVVSSSAVTSALLLEDNTSFLLMEDDVSYLDMEVGEFSVTFASTVSAATTGGTITVSQWAMFDTLDWTLDNWGELLVAVPVGGANQSIYTWHPGDPASQVICKAPFVNDGAILAMPQRQIIAWGSTTNGIQDPLLIRWCDVNDFDQWTALITNQAGSYRIPKGSKIISCLQGPQQTLVWTDLGLWAMQYVGQPFVYQFNEIGVGCGLISRKAAGSLGGTIYWMGQSQFYRLGGGGVEPVPCRVWDVVFQDLDKANAYKIRVAVNSRFGEIAWYYPTTSSGTGEVSAYVKYNVALNEWDYGTLGRTAWINESVHGAPIGAEVQDDGTSIVVQHETSPNANGRAMSSSFRTGWFALNEADMKVFVDEWWPDFKFGYFDGAQTASIQITLYGADFPGGTVRTYGPYTVTNTTTYFTPRIRERLLSIEVSSSDFDSFWRLGGNRYRSMPDGRY